MSVPDELPVKLLPSGGVLALVSGQLGVDSGFVSSDHGTSWQRVTFPLSVVNPDEVLVADDRHWWAFTQEGPVFTTADGGARWRQAALDGLPKLWNFGDRGVIDGDSAWWSLADVASSTSTALAMTADGGAHWKFVKPPQPG